MDFIGFQPYMIQLYVYAMYTHLGGGGGCMIAQCRI